MVPHLVSCVVIAVWIILYGADQMAFTLVKMDTHKSVIKTKTYVAIQRFGATRLVTCMILTVIKQ